MPLTDSQPLFITKGDLNSGNIPVVTKAIMLVTNAFLLFFFLLNLFFSRPKRFPKMTIIKLRICVTVGWILG